MKSKKKLNLKKMSIAQLDSTKGGNQNWTYPTTGTGIPTANPTGCEMVPKDWLVNTLKLQRVV